MNRFAILAATLAAGPCFADVEPPDCGIYTYQAEIIRVIDGDTVEADIDLGFDIWIRNEPLRMHLIEAPERNTEEGQLATKALRERIEGKTLFICTMKMKRKDREAKGSFGRYLVEIYEEGENLNDWLLETGMAEPYQD